MEGRPQCAFCESNATTLYFYTKSYPSGLDTIETPLFACNTCHEKAMASLSICRGGIEGIQKYTFKELGKMSEKKLGHLCARRGYEINHLANKAWRSSIFSIHYHNQPTKKEILADALKWYKKSLEQRITEDFDPTELLTCVEVIQEDIG